MASEDVIKSIWEIATENSDEKIELNEFQKELNTSIDIKIKSMSIEYDAKNLSNEHERTLSIILSQVRANPEVLNQSQGNKFSISDSVISKAVKTMKYQNQFIPGTIEYEQRSLMEKSKNDFSNIVLTTAVVSQMIDNFEKLSFEEKNILLDNFPNMTDFQKSDIFSKISENMDNRAENAKNKEEKEQYKELSELDKKLSELYKLKSEGKYDEIKKILKDTPKYIDIYNKENSENSINIENISNEDIDEVLDFNGKIVIEYEKLVMRKGKLVENGENIPEDLINEIKKINNELFYNEKTNTHNEYYVTEEFSIFKNAKKIEEQMQENQTLEKDQNADTHHEDHVTEELSFFENAKEIAEQMQEFSQTSIDFQAENISGALNIYKEYFQDFDEETIEELKSLSVSELQDGFRDDFIQMTSDGEITKDIYKVLDSIIRNLTEETKNILLDPVKRDSFFEKIESDITNGKDTELIKDSELTEIFKQASVELVLGEITQDKSKQENVQPVPDTDIDSSIINGDNMAIDPEWENRLVEAQQRGEDLESTETLAQIVTEKEQQDREEHEQEQRINSRKQPKISSKPSILGEIAGNEEDTLKPKIELVDVDIDSQDISKPEISGLSQDQNELEGIDSTSKDKRKKEDLSEEHEEVDMQDNSKQQLDNNPQGNKVFSNPFEEMKKFGVIIEEIKEEKEGIATLANEENKKDIDELTLEN